MHLQRVFKSLTSQIDRSEQSSDIADQIAKIYMHALLNRARFACTQKGILSRFHKYIPPKRVKQLVLQKVDAELEYVSKLLRGLTGEEIQHMKRMVSKWMQFVLVDDDDDDDDDMQPYPDGVHTHQGPQRRTNLSKEIFVLFVYQMNTNFS